MRGKQRLVYWDSGIFLAWLSNEPRAREEMDGIAEQIRSIDKGNLLVCTSTITLTEVLRSHLTDAQYNKFRSLFDGQKYQLIDVTRKIAFNAHEIRDYYSKLKDGLGVVTTPDAIHLATAISRQPECEYFYTFDGKNRPNKTRALLPLNGALAGGRFYLEVRKPLASKGFQPELFRS